MAKGGEIQNQRAAETQDAERNLIFWSVDREPLDSDDERGTLDNLIDHLQITIGRLEAARKNLSAGLVTGTPRPCLHRAQQRLSFADFAARVGHDEG